MSSMKITFGELRTQLQYNYDRLNGWREVGALYGVSSGIVYHIAQYGYDPKNPETRQKLGLPCLCEVEVIEGDPLPAHTQSLGARTCRTCGKPFIPNAATRKRCFVCSPYRRGKRKSNSNLPEKGI